MFKDLFTIGIEINIATINLCKLSISRGLISNLVITSPNPFIPGAVTVELCDAVSLIDSNLEAKSVGISLGACLDSSRRMIKHFNDVEGWIDVPFADWLEVRLSREVILLETLQSSIRKSDLAFDFNSKYKRGEIAKEAALFASKKFSGLNSLS